jgi:protein translocase SecG subunit
MIAFMQFIASILPYIQIALAILLIIAILLQTRGSSVGGAFGGSEMGTTFYTRRGAEKTLFQITIALAVLFAVSAFVALFV